MIVKYGSFAHAQNEVEFTIVREPIKGEQGYAIGYTETWQLRGMVTADTQAALTTAINDIKAAYATDGRDLVVYLDDGTTATAHRLLTAASTSGVQVRSGPSFPEGRGAEYSTFRTYTITLDAEIKLGDSALENGLLSWVETISIVGNGGPRFAILEPLNGAPIKQLTHQRTKVRATQQGEGIGRSAYPLPAPPIWPEALKQDESSVTYATPKREGQPGKAKYTEWKTSWSYVYEHTGPLTGSPTIAVG